MTESYPEQMCVNCISNAEAAIAGAALVGSIVKPPLHRALAAAGLVAPPDPVKRDVRTVAFLRALDLDPVDVLGAEVVRRAEAWVPQPFERAKRSWARPIGSQSLLAAQ
jgi:hypothetical protein